MIYTTRQNCWEFKNCGRGPSGSNGNLKNICPAAINTSSDGLNNGKNAGRICWIVAGTFCNGETQGTFAQKRRSCITCDFFKTVESEEGLEEFNILKPGQKYVPTE